MRPRPPALSRRDLLRLPLAAGAVSALPACWVVDAPDDASFRYSEGGADGAPSLWDVYGPLDDNLAMYPPMGDAQDFPESAVWRLGNASGRLWAHGKGYIHAPIENVMQVLSRPEVVIDRRKAVFRTSQPITGIPEAHTAWTAHLDVRGFAGAYDVEFKMAVLEGSSSRPMVAGARYRKVAGIQFLELLHFSLLLRRVSETVTSIEHVEWLKALFQDERTALQTQQDEYASIVAAVHGRELPSYT